MFSLDRVTKKYGKKHAIKDMSFTVNNGEITLLLGVNGAGKTTTINCILNTIDYTGEVYVDDYPNKSIKAKKTLAYLPETPVFFDYLTVWEHMGFFARAYNQVDWSNTAEELLQQFDLWEAKDKVAKNLSKGMKQKLNICTALFHNPTNIIFDEPMIGLDPPAIDLLKKKIAELKENGNTVLVSTHMFDTMADLWDRALIINRGVLVCDITHTEMVSAGRHLDELFHEVTTIPEK